MTQAAAIQIGSKVFLRGCAFGVPGVVLRVERGKLAVLWPDLGPSYIGRHKPETLMLATEKGELCRSATV